MKQSRTSRKQVNELLELLSDDTMKYELMYNEYCGFWKYGIAIYKREPDIVDIFGKALTHTEWKFEKRIINDVALKAVYDYAMELLRNK